MNTQNITSDTELSFTDQLAELGSRGKLHIERLLKANPNKTFVLCKKGDDDEWDADLFDMPTAVLTTKYNDPDPSNITAVLIDHEEIVVCGVGEYEHTTRGTINDLTDEQICFLADHLERLSHETDTDLH